MLSKSKLFNSFIGMGFLVLALGATAEAGPISCNLGDDVDPFFPGAAYRCETPQGVTYGPNNTSGVYSFDAGFITNTLSFDNVVHNMTVFLSAFFVHVDNQDFLDRLPAGYSPATFDTTDGPAWIYFRVEDLQDNPNSGPPQQ